MKRSCPAVYAVVLNWNDAEHTIKCVESLNKVEYSSLEIVVVDNGSTDDSVERLHSQFDNILIVPSNYNRGFAGGMNLGISESLERGADYIWILNNDVLIDDPGVLSDLVTELRNKPDIGILSPFIREYPNTDKIWFEAGRIDLTDGDVGHINITRDDFNNRIVETDYVPFCGPLIRTDLIREIGLLPEDYFLYYEDADYCQSVREHGYRICTVLSSHICHEANASSGGTFDPIFSYYRSRNRFLFAKWNAGDQFVPTKYGWWVVKAVLHRMLYLELTAAKAILEGGLDGILGKSGKGPYP